MIRFLVIAALVVVFWVLLLQLYKQARSSNLDWTGIAFAAGFVALAFYLRHVTGLG